MCTLIVLTSKDQLFVANNEDIFLESGYIFTNQREINKKALVLPPDEPLQWTSLFGSIVFSQSGKEFPSGGMNEKGLVIEQTTLRETKYPPTGSELAIKELQVIQFLLDTCQTVGEALHQMKALRVSQSAAAIQYMLVDASGSMAIVEYLDGEMKIFQDQDIPLPVLANSTYLDSLAFFSSEGERKPAFFDEYAANSLERFSRAAKNLLKTESAETFTSDYAFSLLEQVKRPDTIWNIVYAPIEKKIILRTRWDQAGMTINLDDFDFSNSSLPEYFDLQSPMAGNQSTEFLPYSTEINRNLIQNFYGNEIIRQVLSVDIPGDVLDYLADYPRQMSEN